MIREAKILIVVEDPGMGESLTEALETDSHTVYTAAHALEALSKPFDVVLLHTGLPSASSEEIVRVARSRYEASIILISMKDAKEIEKDKLRLGADEILNTPIKPREVRAAVQRSLDLGKNPVQEIPDSPRILVVDDDHTVLRSLKDILSMDFEVRCTASPSEALGMIKEAPCDIILADLMMEEMTGLELIQMAVNIRPAIIPIVVSGYASKEIAIAALKEGVYDFIEKPFTPDMVIQSVLRAWKHLLVELENRKLVYELRQLNTNLQKEIEERRRTEKALARAKKTAETASRIKTEFMNNMSHELRTPLNGILGGLQVVLLNQLDPNHRKFLEMAYASASDLLHIINDILDFSMIEQGELELDIKPFDLTAVVHETIQEMEMKAQKKGLEMACSIASDVPNDLIGDSGRLSQILRHLVENAVKFTNEGGVSVLVDVKQGPPETPLLHFSVKDTGIGIPLEKQQQIFEAFTQADGSLTRAYDGTGLGLTISSRIVHMMGGEIWVESTSGKGAVFHVDIPFERI